MRHVVMALVVGVAVAASAPMPGCVLRPSESEQAATARSYRFASKAYEAAVNTMTRLAAAGHVDLDTAESFELARATSSSLLNEWSAAIEQNKPFNSGAALDAALDQLIASADRAQQASKGGKS